jgi:ABC-type dipeptide/oligopeptide/nickel transport system permease component
MLTLVARRLLWLAVTAWLVASATFLLGHFARGDYLAQTLAFRADAASLARIRAAHRLDAPLAERYGTWLARLSRLDLGTSLRYQQPAAPLVASRLANTLLLGLTAFTAACAAGLLAGVVTGSRPHGVLPTCLRAASTAGLSCPPLLASLILVWIAATTGVAPVSGMESIERASGWLARLADVLHHLPVPALALALPLAAVVERVTAQAIAQALGEPSIRAARARGVPEGQLLRRHALRLGAAPILSVGGTLAGTALSGSFAVELVTSWPGLGRLTYDALLARDADLAAACAIAAALVLGAAVLAADVALATVDPRLRPEHVRPATEPAA